MRVIYPGHRYGLSNLKATGEQMLQFRQEEPRHPSASGTSCQEVLRALIDRVKTLDAEMPWPGNDAIVMNLRAALVRFEMRALERKVEKGLPIEHLVTDADGHLAFL